MSVYEEDFLQTIVGVSWAKQKELWCAVQVTRPQGGGLTTEAQVSFPSVIGGAEGAQLLNGTEVTSPYLSTPHTLTKADLEEVLVAGTGFLLNGFRLKALVEPSIGTGCFFFKITGNEALEDAPFTILTEFNLSPLSTTSLVVSLYFDVVKEGAKLTGSQDGGLPWVAQTDQKFYDGITTPIVSQYCQVNPTTRTLTFI